MKYIFEKLTVPLIAVASLITGLIISVFYSLITKIQTSEESCEFAQRVNLVTKQMEGYDHCSDTLVNVFPVMWQFSSALYLSVAPFFGLFCGLCLAMFLLLKMPSTNHK